MLNYDNHITMNVATKKFIYFSFPSNLIIFFYILWLKESNALIWGEFEPVKPSP